MVPVATGELDYDVLVVGAGGAGLRAAIEASAHGAKTGVICKSLLGKASTVLAHDGIAAALGTVHARDGWRSHFRDTMRAGQSINDWRMAQIHAQEAPARLYELESWGALFDRTSDGRIAQRHRGGHLYARMACRADRIGLEMMRALQQRAVHSGVDVHAECSVHRLLLHDGRICGALALQRATGRFVVFRCKAVVLASGGAAAAWNSGPADSTGDGPALAVQAGAELADMEFVQFPWHQVLGGIRVDAHSAASSVPGLFAAGEVAAGLHGAAALGGNALSVALVFGRRAGFSAAEYSRALTTALGIEAIAVEPYTRNLLAPLYRRGGENPFALRAELRSCMHELAGVSRSGEGLVRALMTIREIGARSRAVSLTGGRAYNGGWHAWLDLRSLLVFSEATVVAALERRETRGSHVRRDFPASDPNYDGMSVIVRKSSQGLMSAPRPLSEMPRELKRLIQWDKTRLKRTVRFAYGAATPKAGNSANTG